MNKKSIAALAIAATMTLGVGASSYAWFTSSAKSDNNNFQAGTLTTAITGNAWTGQTNADANKTGMDNMEPGDTKIYSFAVNNTGTLNQKYFVKLSDDHTGTKANLINVALFTLKNNGTVVTLNNKALSGLSFTDLNDALATPFTLTHGSSDVYTIEVNLPTTVDDNYQDGTGAFGLHIRSTQTISTLTYSDIVEK